MVSLAATLRARRHRGAGPLRPRGRNGRRDRGASPTSRFASVIAQARQALRAVNAVNTAFGVVLPDGPRRVTRGACHVRRCRTGPMDRERGRRGCRGLRRTGARAHRPVRGGVGSVGRAAGAARQRAARARRACQGRAGRPASEGVQAGRHRVHAGRLYQHADRHAGRGDLSARRAAQHGGQFLVVAHGIRRRVRLRSRDAGVLVDASARSAVPSAQRRDHRRVERPDPHRRAAGARSPSTASRARSSRSIRTRRRSRG